MYGPNKLGTGFTLGAATVLPATGSNRTLFIAAATLLVAGLVTLVVSKLIAVKG